MIVAICAGAVLAALLLPVSVQRVGAQPYPSGREVIDRVLATIRRADLSAVDMAIKFRIDRPPEAEPDCEFKGVLHLSPDHSALALAQWTPRPVCWVIERYVLGRLFADRDRGDVLLPRFRFEVIGFKLVRGRPHYLVTGQAIARETDPSWMIGWIDYERGLVDDGTVRYGWGEVTSAQDYDQVRGIWVPVHQYLSVPKFRASLEIWYSRFRFAGGP